VGVQEEKYGEKIFVTRDGGEARNCLPGRNMQQLPESWQVNNGASLEKKIVVLQSSYAYGR